MPADFSWPGDFRSFIETLRLRHFDAAEFLIGLRRGNSEPPVELWPNIAATAVVLDQVREHFSQPTFITSAYRSADYNRKVGGSRRSQHMAFTALDFKVRGVAPRDAFALLKSWRGRLFEIHPGFVSRRHALPSMPHAQLDMWFHSELPDVFRFSGGIGLYERFVHVDTRGINATW